jgi:hypothetical protein
MEFHMLRELDRAVLTRDFPEHELIAGDSARDPFLRDQTTRH